MVDIVNQARYAGGGATPQANYEWRMNLPLLSKIIQHCGGYDPAIMQRIGTITASDIFRLDLRVQNITVPQGSIDVARAYSGVGEWKFAKRASVGQLTFDIMEFDDGLTTKYLSLWLSLIRNSNNTFNPPAVYKRDVTIIRYKKNGDEASQSYTFRNAFISGISEVRSSYSENGAMMYTVTLEGDGFMQGLGYNSDTWGMDF